MPIKDIENNNLHWEDWTGKISVVEYTNEIFPVWDWTNEDEAIAILDALTYEDLGYYENYDASITKWDEKIVNTDYCGAGEIKRTIEDVPKFSYDTQEILNMPLLAKILWRAINIDSATWEEIIQVNRKMSTSKYFIFKFVTCPKDGKYNILYHVKAVRTSDIQLPVKNLIKDEFVGSTMEYEVAKGWSFFIKKWVAV